MATRARATHGAPEKKTKKTAGPLSKRQQGLLGALDARLDRPIDIPVTDILAESRELQGHLEEIGPQLVARSRVEAADLAALPARTALLDAAQQAWVITRQRTSSTARVDARKAAKAIVAPLLAELRHFLAGDREIELRLRELAVGRSDGAVVQRLRDLADLHDAHASELEKADLPADVAQRARAAAAALEQQHFDKARIGAALDAQSLRNRAYWSLRELLDLIRSAGRHVFRDDEHRRKWFYASSSRAVQRTATRRRTRD